MGIVIMLCSPVFFGLGFVIIFLWGKTAAHEIIGGISVMCGLMCFIGGAIVSRLDQANKYAKAARRTRRTA